VKKVKIIAFLDIFPANKADLILGLFAEEDKLLLFLADQS